MLMFPCDKWIYKTCGCECEECCKSKCRVILCPVKRCCYYYSCKCCDDCCCKKCTPCDFAFDDPCCKKCTPCDFAFDDPCCKKCTPCDCCCKKCPTYAYIVKDYCCKKSTPCDSAFEDRFCSDGINISSCCCNSPNFYKDCSEYTLNADGEFAIPVSRIPTGTCYRGTLCIYNGGTTTITTTINGSSPQELRYTPPGKSDTYTICNGPIRSILIQDGVAGATGRYCLNLFVK